MTTKFDAKQQAHSISKLLTMSEACMLKPGGGIHAERLIDYASSEFERLTAPQRSQVLAAIDKDCEKKLLKDGEGAIIGYVHSKRIFVMLRQQQSEGESDFSKLAKRITKTKKRS